MGSIFPQNKWTLPRYPDPWFKAEQWRYEHPALAMKYNWRRVLPGFGYGTVAFVAYCALEWAFFPAKDHHHHHHQQHDKHHSPNDSPSTETAKSPH